MTLILTFCLLLALFGKSDSVNGQVKGSRPLKGTLLSVTVDPGGVTGQSLWVKADLGLEVNGSDQVQQWFDQSGSGNTTTELRASLPAHTNAIAASSAILRVPNGINFNPVVDFSATSGRSLKGNANTEWDVTPLSIFTVALPEGTQGANYGGVFTANANWTADVAGNAGIGVVATPSGYGLDGNGCTVALTLSSIAEPRILRGIYISGANGNGGSTWLNGVQERTGTSCGTNATTLFEVGGRTAGTTSGGPLDNRIFNGKIAEVVVYKSVLTAANANKVESYLSVKYGITLRQTPSPQNYVASDGTTIFWNSATNTIYNKNIAGIGQDDTSGLNQKQSRSVNLAASGNMVTMGLGTIAADNASNTNTFGANLNFLTWGDDGASAGFTTLITPPVGIVATVRLTRIWNVQETGAVPTVKVGIPANLGGGNIVYLAVSSDTTFDAADQYIPLTPLTVGSTTYQAADFDFTSGQFFTFATLPAIPGGVAAPVTWQKANDGAPTGALWDDSSAGGNDAAQGTAANRPTFVPGSDTTGAINFNPGFDFDGVNDFLNFPTSLGIGGLTDSSSFFVHKQDALTGGVLLGDDGTPGANQFLLAVGGTIPGDFRSSVGHGGTPCDVATTTALSVNEPGIDAAVRASSNMTVRLNGGSAATGPCASPFTSNPRRLAAREDSFFAAIIGEFIEYDRALSANEQQRVESYLAVKYGITLDQTVPTSYLASDSTVIWDSAANAVYNNDITGIGRDDVSALNQKQSASVNVGNFVTIGHSSIAADNETNPNDFSANKDFLVWGHDGGSTPFAVPMTGTGLLRMTRVWKAQENAVDNVVVRVPQSLFTNPFPTLVRSTDSTFDNTDTFVPMTLNGTNYEATIDFNNGDFFTFAQSLSPTAAHVSISGRLSTSAGYGVANAVVTLSDGEGHTLTARSSSFGYFTFDDVETGKTYILSVSAKRYQFQPQALSVNDEVSGLVLIAQ